MKIKIYFQNYNKKRIFIACSLAALLLSSFISYIIALYAFISPSQDLRWEGSVSYLNKPSYSPGDTVNIIGALEEGAQYFLSGNYYDFKSPINVRWVLIVKDPNNMPVHIDTGLLSDFIGDTELSPVTVYLPSDAAVGIYKIRVFVWTDWLPIGETRTLNIIEREFTVT